MRGNSHSPSEVRSKLRQLLLLSFGVFVCVFACVGFGLEQHVHLAFREVMRQTHSQEERVD